MFFSLGPWNWLHWRNTSFSFGGGRAGTTGRDRAANISWLVLIVGVCTFLYVSLRVACSGVRAYKELIMYRPCGKAFVRGVAACLKKLANGSWTCKEMMTTMMISEEWGCRMRSPHRQLCATLHNLTFANDGKRRRLATQESLQPPGPECDIRQARVPCRTHVSASPSLLHSSALEVNRTSLSCHSLFVSGVSISQRAKMNSSKSAFRSGRLALDLVRALWAPPAFSALWNSLLLALAHRRGAR